MAFEANWFNWSHFRLEFRWGATHRHRHFHRFRRRLARLMAAKAGHLLAWKRERHGTHRLDGVAVLIQHLEDKFLRHRGFEIHAAILLHGNDAQRDTRRILAFETDHRHAHGMVRLQDVLHNAQPFDFHALRHRLI